MSANPAFDWLTGAMRIPADAPPEWAGEGLGAFYQGPNDERWGGTLCRVLYHESIHFWQLLSSAYLANLTQYEWVRLEAFEATGEVEPPHAMVRAFTQRGDGEPFSAHELMECWARYWDVHTRSPARIAEEEGLTRADGRPLTTRVAGFEAYTGEAFDLVMSEGRDARLYAAPYRWLLERCQGNSSLANLLFPILAFHAFGSPRPVALFLAALECELATEHVRLGVHPRERLHSINFHWLNNYGPVVREAVEPARRALGLPAFTGGWDVIARGRLGSHPVYREYLNRIGATFRMLAMNAVEPPDEVTPEAYYQYALRDLPRHEPAVLFAFPGQPGYRLMLGEHVPPPLVRFANVARSEDVQPAARVLARFQAAAGGEVLDEDALHFEPVVRDLEARVRRFREAEYLTSLGLPSDAVA